jgi:hypothetical protein
MYDLFLDQKVLDYNADRYELILYTLRWARTLKGKGSAEPMQELIEKALKDIVEGRITKEEILSTKTAQAPVVAEEVPAVVSLADEEAPKTAKLAADGEEDEEKKKAKKKKAK